MSKRNQYIKLIDRYTKRAIKCIIISIFVILIVQTLMQVNSVRKLIVPTERWEGVRIETP